MDGFGSPRAVCDSRVSGKRFCVSYVCVSAKRLKVSAHVFHCCHVEVNIEIA